MHGRERVVVIEGIDERDVPLREVDIDAAKPSIGKERARRFLEETEEVRRAAIAHLVAADLLLMQIRRRAA